MSRKLLQHVARMMILYTIIAGWILSPQSTPGQAAKTKPRSFELMETSIDAIHGAYKAGLLTSHELTQEYLNRIDAYDQKGPAINSIITINPKALEEADWLDAQFKKSGFVGPLHGIPVLVKDEIDTVGMPTTLGSVLFKNGSAQELDATRILGGLLQNDEFGLCRSHALGLEQ